MGPPPTFVAPTPFSSTLTGTQLEPRFRSSARATLPPSTRARAKTDKSRLRLARSLICLFIVLLPCPFDHEHRFRLNHRSGCQNSHPGHHCPLRVPTATGHIRQFSLHPGNRSDRRSENTETKRRMGSSGHSRLAKWGPSPHALLKLLGILSNNFGGPLASLPVSRFRRARKVLSVVEAQPAKERKLRGAPPTEHYLSTMGSGLGLKVSPILAA